MPTPKTPVSDQAFVLGALPGPEVTFRAPSGWEKVPTGRADVVRFTHPAGGTLTLRLTTGVTDFDTAAPRRLRELEIGGVDARFTGDLRGDAFAGRTCTATGGGRSGDCAVVSRADLIVTVLALRSADGPPADVAAVVRSLKEA